MPLDHNPWSTACPDWKERIREGRSLVPDLPLFAPVAEKALRVFKSLRVPDMIGTPTLGEVCEEWIFDLVRAVFGAYDPDTRRRMIRQFFVMIPKKNGKSSISAAIIVTAAILNERPNAEAILIAETQKIAEIAFSQAAGIIKLDPRLDKDSGGIFDVKSHSKTIIHMNTGATIRILSADGDVVTGSKAAYVLVDETHVLGHKAKAPGVYLELEGGLAARPEGFLLEITTQSKVPPHGEFKRRLSLARGVRDGKLNLPILPVLYELPQDMQASGAWRDEETWRLVNPNIERSVSIDYLREKFAEAEVGGQEALSLFASQHLNVEMGVGLHADVWSGAAYWEAAKMPDLTFDVLLGLVDVCTIGVDGGGMDDIASLGVMGRHRENGDWLFWQQSWAQPEVFERRKSIAPALEDFKRSGDLIVRNSESEIGQDMRAICRRIFDAGLLPEEHGIGYDSSGPATGLEEIEEDADLAKRVTGVSQGYRMQRAVLQIPNKLKVQEFRHCGQPIMAWAAGNAKMELVGSNWLVKKQTAGASKIDPLMAMFDAAMLMFLNPVAKGLSVYRERGLLVV
ncbi:terminase large subunit [Defluviimonas sp. SAOS-178_SWC]|uniref:terminase large subunit n=1 Tax=Defluviimonas sp. SAOS-178_SWC TaxID=3121287 RepID=UPI003221ABD2